MRVESHGTKYMSDSSITYRTLVLYICAISRRHKWFRGKKQYIKLLYHKTTVAMWNAISVQIQTRTSPRNRCKYNDAFMRRMSTVSFMFHRLKVSNISGCSCTGNTFKHRFELLASAPDTVVLAALLLSIAHHTWLAIVGPGINNDAWQSALSCYGVRCCICRTTLPSLQCLEPDAYRFCAPTQTVRASTSPLYRSSSPELLCLPAKMSP